MRRPCPEQRKALLRPSWGPSQGPLGPSSAVPENPKRGPLGALWGPSKAFQCRLGSQEGSKKGPLGGPKKAPRGAQEESSRSHAGGLSRDFGLTSLGPLLEPSWGPVGALRGPPVRSRRVPGRLEEGPRSQAEVTLRFNSPRAARGALLGPSLNMCLGPFETALDGPGGLRRGRNN